MEKNILKEYTAKIEQLKNAFQDLEKNNLIPVVHGEKSYTSENINEVLGNLDKQEFTISVCGQINAGKSSFLNYLLFNDKEVLPADDTPWTAKLTTVRYGEENYATVTYYNQKEWDLLKSQQITDDEGSSTTYYDEFLKEDVNNAALAGLQVESYITNDNKIVTGVALNELREYVTKGGQQTPFVKQVDIKVKNELAKGVVFVDTPGINDRNELRSKVTEDWIKKSCAVIYLFYAGQALSTADYDFIDQHLSSVPTDKILFALTKADISEDYEGAKSFVERTLKEDEELKKRKFITANKSVYPISTLSALINYKHQNNIELNEDEEFHLDRILEESPSFIKNNGFIDEFTDGLKSHLMTQTGKAILDKATEFLFDIYKTNETSLQSDLNTTKEKLTDLELSDEELKQKKDLLDQTIDNIIIFKKKFERNKQDEFVVNFKLKLNENLKTLRKSGFKNLEKELEDSSHDSIKTLRRLATHLTKQSLEETIYEVNNILLNKLYLKENLDELLQTFSNDFQIIIQEAKVYEGSLSCRFEDQSALVEHISFDQLSIEKLKKTCDSNWGLNADKVKKQIMAEIQIAFETYLKKIFKEVVANVNTIIEQNLEEVYNNVTTEVKKIKSNANSLLASSKSYAEEKNNLQSEIVQTKERLDFVETNFKKLKKCI